MKVDYGGRLRAARKHKGLSQQQLAELSGVKQGTISKIERGDQETSTADIKLAMALDVHPLWLSEGDKRYAPEWTTTTHRSIISPPNNSNGPSLRIIHVIGSVQFDDAGLWSDMDSSVEQDTFIKFPTQDKDAYGVRCIGDMMRPRIKNGEYIIAEPNTPAAPGDEVVVKSSAGKMMVKTFLYERDNYVYLQSVNEARPSFSIPKADISTLHYVAGIVKIRGDKRTQH